MTEQDTSGPTFESAMKRLEEIAQLTEADATDIDRLVSNLKEAKQLIAFCRGKLYRTEEEIKQVQAWEKEN